MIAVDFNWILIRYGEIGLKSDYVRKSFENRLINNIREGLKTRGFDGKVKRGYGRIFVSTSEVKKASEVLEHTFGVVSFSPCIKIEADFEGVVKKLADLASDHISKKDTFAVRVRRTGNHDFSSKDVEKEAGSRILEETDAEVDLDDPDERVMADIRQGQCYVFREKISGPGGLPIGTQGRVVSLFRGDCGSFLATWMMMKRGCSVTLLIGSMDPYSADISTGALEELKKWDHGSPLDVLDFDHGVNLFRFSEDGEKGYVCVLCKRFLHRLASRVAEDRDAKAIVSGDHLQENFDSFKLTDSVVNIPVIRPLVGFGKDEIRSKCREVGGEFILKEHGCEAEDRDTFDVKGKRLEEIEEKLDIEEMVEESFVEAIPDEDT